MIGINDEEDRERGRKPRMIFIYWQVRTTSCLFFLVVLLLFVDVFRLCRVRWYRFWVGFVLRTTVTVSNQAAKDTVRCRSGNCVRSTTLSAGMARASVNIVAPGGLRRALLTGTGSRSARTVDVDINTSETNMLESTYCTSTTTVVVQDGEMENDKKVVPKISFCVSNYP